MLGKFNKLSGPTAATILTKLKTVDGAGSGLDADLIDGAAAGGGAFPLTTVAKTADFTVNADKTLYTNRAATGVVHFTLPAAPTDKQLVGFQRVTAVGGDYLSVSPGAGTTLAHPHRNFAATGAKLYVLGSLVIQYDLANTEWQVLHESHTGDLPVVLGAAAWWHPDDVVVTSAPDVDSWPCRISGVAPAQSTASKKPHNDVNFASGAAGVDFDGTQHQLSARAFPGGGDDMASPLAMFVALDSDSIAASVMLIEVQRNGQAIDKWLQVVGTSGLLSSGVAGANGANTVNALTIDTPRVAEAVFSGEDSHESVLDGDDANKGANAAASASDNTIGRVNLGHFLAAGAASQFFNGLLGEIIFLRRVPSTKDRKDLRAYLAAIYGATLV